MTTPVLPTEQAYSSEEEVKMTIEVLLLEQDSSSE